MSITRPLDTPHGQSPVGEAPAQGIKLRIHPARVQAISEVQAAHHWDRIDGSPWMQRHDLQEGSLLRLPGLADFLINAEGTAVDAWPMPELDREACHQLFLNNVLPMALSRQGKLVLHASAVEVGEAAIVFVGVSGRGKSTLATSFSHDGHALIVDDGLVVEAAGQHAMALPGEHSVRLWRDSEQLLGSHATAAGQRLGYADKRRIPAGDTLRFSVQARPIRAVFLLGDDPQAALSIRPLAPAQALIELIHYSFLLDVGNPARHAALMRANAQLASSCTVSLLDYPRDFAQLPWVRKSILDYLQMSPSTP